MSALILNRKTFSLPEDGWYQLAPLGEFSHGDSGLVQVVDSAACEAMVVDFRNKSQADNFAGVLIDFDHFSLDAGRKSEAAGWITNLETRSSGLWANIRWSDLGEDAVKGGRYRFLSPVWARSDCEELEGNRIRPIRLLNAAVTNDPNLKGMVPLSNSRTSNFERPWPSPCDSSGRRTSNVELLANAEGEKRLKWVLGDSPDDRHCPSCEALAGQVHSREEWEAAGVTPGGSNLHCQHHCHCKLVETDETTSGSLSRVPLRKEEDTMMSNARLVDEELENIGWTRLRQGYGGQADEELENIGWTDEARAASLAVRRAKAAKRKESGGTGSDGSSDSEDSGSSDPSFDGIRDKWERGEPLTKEELDHVDQLMEDGYAGESDSDPVFQFMERWSMMDPEDREATRSEAKSGKSPKTEKPDSREKGEDSGGGAKDRDVAEEKLIKRLESGEWMSEEDRATAEKLRDIRDGKAILKYRHRSMSASDAVWEDKQRLREKRIG